MIKLLFKITLHLYLIIQYIKCFSESNISYLVDHAQSNVQTNLPSHSQDYHHMPFSSFGLNPTDPSFTIVGQFQGDLIDNKYQVFFQIYNNVNHDVKLVMFGYDQISQAIFVRQQYADASYSGEILHQPSQLQEPFSQFTLSLRKSTTQTDINFTLNNGLSVIFSQSSSFSTNMLDWNNGYTVQFSDSGVSVPNGQRIEYSAQGSVSRVILIKDTYIGSYGNVAQQFIKRLTFYSQEKISIFNKYNTNADIQSKCIPDESIERSACPQSTNSNKLPQVANSIATFLNEYDIIFKNISLYQLFSHFNKFKPSLFFTYSFWLYVEQGEQTFQILYQQNKLNHYLQINVKNDNNGFKVQVQSYNGGSDSWECSQIFNFQKFYYLIFSYYQYSSASDMRLIIIDDTGTLNEYQNIGIKTVLVYTIPDTFTIDLQVGNSYTTQMSEFFQLSQFQMNLSAAILYDEQSYPQVVDSTQIIQNCQVIILIRLKYQCMVCKFGFFLLDNSCKSSCDSGYTPKVSIRTCVRVCSYRCSTCQANPNNCITCSSSDRDLSTNCGCKSGYEDQISSECSTYKAQNVNNSDMEILYLQQTTSNQLQQITFKKNFKKAPLIIPLVVYFKNDGNFMKGIITKTIELNESSCKLDIQTSYLGLGVATEYRISILAISMDPQKYYSKQLDFDTPTPSTYQQNIDIGTYDTSKYGDYQVLTFLSGIMMGRDSTYSYLFADYKINVINNKQQIQVVVNDYVKRISVTYLILPSSTPSLFQFFQFQSASFYYDTSNTFISKVHSDTINITNNLMKQKRYLFTSYFSLASMGYQLSLSDFRYCYSYASQNDLGKQYTRFEIDTFQSSQYSTNGFYFIELFDKDHDKCVIKDYYTQEGCYKCKVLYADEANDCNSCKGNRILNQSSCDCPDSDFKKIYTDEINCSYKETATLDINLLTDFSQIIIDFGLMIEPISYQNESQPSYELCKHLFSFGTLSKLKQSASCLIIGTIILVYLDKDATIQKGSLMNFQENIKFINYPDPITEFLRRTVSQIDLPYVAEVVISFNQEVNLCESLSLIQVLEFKNHQRRGLKMFEWSFISVDPPNNQNNLIQFQQLISNANINKDLVLNVAGYFQENSIVTISLKFEYNIGLKGQKQIQFKVVSTHVLNLKSRTTRNPPFYIIKINSLFNKIRKDKVEIFFDIFYTKCDINGKIIQISQQTNNLQIANTINQTKESTFSILIPEYTTKPDTMYQITVTCSVSGTAYEYKLDYFLTTKSSPLLIKINGGDRQFDYYEDITIDSVSKDLDLIQNQSLGIDLTWSCLTLETFRPCADIEKQIIDIPQGSNEISFPKLTFISFQTNQFTLMGKKDNKQFEDKVSIQFVDKSIPQIKFIWPTDFLLKPTINLNDIIQAEIVIDSSININKVYFGAAIIYKRQVQATITFEYGKFRILLWDYPLQFEQSKTRFQIRFLVFNPKYTQPSQETYYFNVNFPPQNCILNISPSNGYSLQTLFTIQVNKCEDPDQPLSYQFYYYSQKQQFDLEVKSPLLIQRKQLSDATQESIIQSYLPSGELLILVQIFDSKNAIKNITQTLTVQQPTYDETQYKNQVQNIIDYSEQQIYSTQILSLSLACEDIVSRTNYYNSLQDQASYIVNQLQKLTVNVPKHSTFSTLATQSIQQVVNSKVFQIDNTFLQSIYNYISGILEKASSELLKDSFLQNKSNQQLYNCFTLLDTISDSSQSNLETQQSLLRYTEQLGNLLNVDAFPNESSKILKGQKISIVSQIITRQQDGMGSWENMVNEQDNKDPINQVYDVSFKSYEHNIYQQDVEYQNFIKKVQEQKPTLKLNTYKAINPQIQLHDSQLVFTPQTSLKFQFQPIENETLTCVNNVKGSWSAQGCEPIYDKRTKLYNCICEDLSPITVINDVADIFTNNENIDTIFSEDGVENILGFNNFQDYAAFWVECFIAIIFIIFSLFGLFLDKLRQTSTQFGQIASITLTSPNMLTQSSPKNNNQILKYEDITETIEDQQTQNNKSIQFSKQDNEIERQRRSKKHDFLSSVESVFKNKSSQLQVTQQKRSSSIFNDKNKKNLQKNIHVQGDQDSLKLNDQTSRQSSESSENHILRKRNTSFPTEERVQDVKKKFKEAGLFRAMYYFHDLFSIFLMFDPSISRVTRLVIMYLKNLHIFTSNIVFNKQYSITQTIILQLINIIITAFITKLIEFGISKNIILRRVCQFLIFTLILFYYYAFLAVISGTQPSQTNTISLLYFAVLLVDIFVISVSLAFLQRFIANHILQNNQQIVGFREIILNFFKFQLILINI